MSKIKICSYSGGKTSGYMSQDDCYDIRIFANPGLEHSKTLDHIKMCDEYFGWNLVWVEAVFNQEKGQPTTHKIVNYETACRDHRLFEGMAKKYGIPNVEYFHCTRELKLQPISSYLKSLGLTKKDYQMAIGIRYDEDHRISKNATENSLYYPLVDKKITKMDVNLFWESMPFNLEIEPYLGNCVTCHKKSDRKLFTVIRQMPELFKPLAEIERKYGHVNNTDGVTKRTFWRKNRTTQQMIVEALSQMDLFWDADLYDPDAYDECGESCEIFT